MEENKLLELKKANLDKALSHQEGDYVPTIVAATCATISWAGKKATEVLKDENDYVDALTAVFDEMWADGAAYCGAQQTKRLDLALETLENKYGPDGTTLEHVQLSPMKADEYPQLIDDPDQYVAEVLLPRKYPKLYADRKYAKNALKVYAEDRVYTLGKLSAAATKTMKEKYGITYLIDMKEQIETPLDMLFDFFRGFRGTLTDLRRQPDNVRAALDRLWEVRNVPKLEKPYADVSLFAPQMPHIPAYLSPKQFDELYWPHQKKLIERVAAAGGKAYIVLEGNWEKVWHHFLELPKDSCILHVDDDDIIKAHEVLGGHQILCGGLKSADVRLKTFEQIKDDVKRVIDTCAPGGGFLFSTDKAWIAPGDVNQTLIDTFNFVHEYTKK